MTFKVPIFPDTQQFADSDTYSNRFDAMAQYVADNRVAENYIFASHVGDIVEDGSVAGEWVRADTAMSILDDSAPSVGYGVSLGNHDCDVSNGNGLPSVAATNYIANFGAARVSGRSWFKSAGPRDRNHCQEFSSDGRSYLHFNIEYAACSFLGAIRTALIDWFDALLAANPTHKVIITTHYYLTGGGIRHAHGEAVFDALVDNNPQVFLVIGGHTGGLVHRTVTNAAGGSVHEILSNFQLEAHWADGYMQFLEFDTDNDEINVTTYSPYLDASLTGPNEQYTLTMDFPLEVAMTDYNFKASEKHPQLLDSLQRWNREKSMSFDGGDVMASADFAKIVTGKQAYTIYMVVEASDLSVFLMSATNGDARFYINYLNGNGRMYCYQVDNNGDGLGSVYADTGAAGPLEKIVVCFRNNGLVNGVDGGCDSFAGDVSTKRTDAAFNTGGEIDLGSAVTYFCDQDTAGSGGLTGETPGIWAASVAHTDSEVAYVTEALRDKYTVDGWGYDGVNAYTTVTDVATLDLPDGDWSLGGWVKLDSNVGTGMSSLISTRGWGDANSFLLAVAQASYGTPNQLYFYAKGTTEDVTHWIAATASVGTSTDWQHIAICYDDSAETIQLYINGVATGGAIAASGSLGGVSSSSIYCGYLSSAHKLNGTLRDWFKTDRLITGAEIAELVSGGYAEDMADGAPSEDNGWNMVMNAAEAETTGGFQANGTGHTVTHSDDSPTSPATSYVTPEYK